MKRVRIKLVYCLIQTIASLGGGSRWFEDNNVGTFEHVLFKHRISGVNRKVDLMHLEVTRVVPRLNRPLTTLRHVFLCLNLAIFLPLNY